MKFDDETKTAQVSLRAEEVLAKLNEKEMADPNGKCYNNDILFTNFRNYTGICCGSE